MDGRAVLLFTLAIILLHYSEGSEHCKKQNPGHKVSIIAELVPRGNEAVNGSNITIGCNGTIYHCGKLKVCTNNSLFTVNRDDNDDTINTSDPNWASELVTVRKSKKSAVHDFPHVLLTFAFEYAVIPESIEMDLFLCPKWKIDAPYITLFGYNESDLVYLGFENYGLNSDFILNHLPQNKSCDRLSRISLTPQNGEPCYYNWHILVSFSLDESIEWVHIGEVIFNIREADLNSQHPFLKVSSSICSTSPNQTSPSVRSTPMSMSVRAKPSMSVRSTPMSMSVRTASSMSVRAKPSMSVRTTPSMSVRAKPAMSVRTTPSMSVRSTPVSMSVRTAPSMSVRAKPSMSVRITPSMSVRAKPAISVRSTPSMSVRAKPAMSVRSTPSMSVRAKPAMSVRSTPSMSVRAKPAMSVKSTPSMSVREKPAMSVRSTPSMSVRSTPSMSVRTTLSATMSGRSMSSSPTQVSLSTSPSTQVEPSVRPTMVTSISTHVSDSENGDKNTDIPILLIVVVPGLLLLVLLVLIMCTVVGYSFSRHHRVRERATERAGFEALLSEPDLSSPEVSQVSERNFIVNPIYEPLQSILRSRARRRPSPREAAPERPVYFNLYQDVNPETLSPRVTPSSGNSSGSPTASSQSRMAGVASHSPTGVTGPQAVMPTPSPDGSEMTSASAYSSVQRRRAPVIPPKSSDLLQYLATRSNLSMNVYNLPIKPSDFINSDAREGDSDPEICAPIYPSSTSPKHYKELRSECLREMKEIGIGQFGKVFLAVTNTRNERMRAMGIKQGSLMIVAMEKMKPNPSPIEQAAFDKEVNFLAQLRHSNVLGLIGVSYQSPAFVMMEFTEEGDLNQFLQKYSVIVPITTQSGVNQMTTSTLLYMASQIASAMSYLASFKFVHCDLAARSCFVGNNFTVKIAAKGISGHPYQFHYFPIRGNRLLPIRWMATECFSGKFSEKSDVWAFGVTMWELFTLAEELPYSHLSDDEVIHNAFRRHLRQFPSKPVACPQPVCEIMQKCWISDFQQRPTFQEINVMLHTST